MHDLTLLPNPCCELNLLPNPSKTLTSCPTHACTISLGGAKCACQLPCMYELQLATCTQCKTGWNQTCLSIPTWVELNVPGSIYDADHMSNPTNVQGHSPNPTLASCQSNSHGNCMLVTIAPSTKSSPHACLDMPKLRHLYKCFH